MKSILLIFLLLIVFSGHAQKKPVKILFDVTSKDTMTHDAVLRHVSGMAKAYPDAQLEVVVYGGAWPLVVNSPSKSARTVADLAAKENVSFKICGITMQRHGVEASDIIAGVETVPDAIIEIVTKQGEGWGYIKESGN